MHTWKVNYQVKVAPKTFYPRVIEVPAETRRQAKANALKIIKENTDDEFAEKIIIGEIELA